MTFNEEFNELVKVTLSEKQQRNQTGDKNLQIKDESAKSQDFFQDNNAPRKRYTTTRIKSRNVLSDIGYVGINKGYYYNENFVLNVYLLITENLKPFPLDRKLADKTKHEMIYMLWKEYMPQKFYKHIFKEKNFLYLNGKNVPQPKVVKIITDVFNEDEKNYRKLRNNPSSYKGIIQYVNSNFPQRFIVPRKNEVLT